MLWTHPRRAWGFQGRDSDSLQWVTGFTSECDIGVNNVWRAIVACEGLAVL
jgi:hypothetical protein